MIFNTGLAHSGSGAPTYVNSDREALVCAIMLSQMKVDDLTEDNSHDMNTQNSAID